MAARARPLAAAPGIPYLFTMAKIGRNASSGRFVVSPNGNDTGATIRQNASGKTLPLKGYGALKGQFVVRKGMNLSKPIAAQAARKKKATRSVTKSA